MFPSVSKPEQETDFVNTIQEKLNNSDFSKIIHSNTFVDKTMMIEKVINYNKKILLTTVPHGFGKSTILSMLKIFLAIEVDEQGKKIQDTSSTKNYKLLTTKHNGETLQIAADKGFMDNHLGKYPVIFVDFASVTSTDYKNIKKEMWCAISQAFQEHQYITEKLSEKQKDREDFNKEEFTKICNNDIDQVKEDTITTSLRGLTKLLFDYWQRKVYVLIDNYEAPIRSALTKCEQQEMYDIYDLLINGIFDNVFNNNDTYLERGFMTGMIGVLGNSKLDNIIEYKFLHKHRFTDYYGFTKREITELAQSLDINASLEETITHSGYAIQQDDNAEIDNPVNFMLRCIKNALNDEALIFNQLNVVQLMQNISIHNNQKKDYTSNEMVSVLEIADIQQEILQLITGQSIKLDLSTTFTKEGLGGLHRILKYNLNDSELCFDLFFLYMLQLGHLSCTTMPGYYKMHDQQIKSEYVQQLVDYYFGFSNPRRAIFDQAVIRLSSIIKDTKTSTGNDIITTDFEKFEELLNRLFAGTPQKYLDNTLYYSIVNLMIFQAIKQIPQSEFWNEQKQMNDIMLINNHESYENDPDAYKMGMIIETQYNDGNNAITTVPDITARYKNVVEQHNDLKIIKYMSINVAKDKTVTIQYQPENNLGYDKSHLEDSVYAVFNDYNDQNMIKNLKLKIKELLEDNITKVEILYNKKYVLTQDKDSTTVRNILLDLKLSEMQQGAIALVLCNDIENQSKIGLMIIKEDDQNLKIHYVIPPQDENILKKLSHDLETETSQLLHMKANIQPLAAQRQCSNDEEITENCILGLTQVLNDVSLQETSLSGDNQYAIE